MKPTTLSQQADLQLIDVRLPDDFENRHIEGAQHNCVFEMKFGGRLEEMALDKSKLTVVYGADHISGEAAAASEKLRRFGFTNIEILEGGIEQAIKDNLATVKGKDLDVAPEVLAGDRDVDIDNSVVEWTGKNLLNKHSGSVAIKSGTLKFSNGEISGGELTLDLKNMKCYDLADSKYHDALIRHLHDDDFFDVSNHPEAVFKIREVQTDANASKGSRNLTLKGDFTLRGQTHPIEFSATSGQTGDGKFVAQANLSIDRTRWGVLYGSGKFFKRVAGHLVNDMLEIQLKIVTI